MDSVFNAGGVDKDSRHVTQIYYTVDFGEDGAGKVEGGKGSEAILSKKPCTVPARSAYAPTILPRLLTERARVQAAPGTSTVVYFSELSRRNPCGVKCESVYVPTMKMAV